MKETESETKATEETVPETGADTDTEAETDAPLELKNPEIDERYFVYRIWNFRKNSLSDFRAVLSGLSPEDRATAVKECAAELKKTRSAK